MCDEGKWGTFVRSICAFCRKPGADRPWNKTFWAWVHSSCAKEPGRLEAIAHGKCFFCLEGSNGPDMEPYAPRSPRQRKWDDPDALAWAHQSCIEGFEMGLEMDFAEIWPELAGE